MQLDVFVLEGSDYESGSESESEEEVVGDDGVVRRRKKKKGRTKKGKKWNRIEAVLIWKFEFASQNQILEFIFI